MNNHGQLGLGHKQSVAIAQKIKHLDPYMEDHVVQIVGGEHHSVVLWKSGCVYCFGRNDEGQIGIGDLFGDFKRKKAEEKRLKEEQAAKEKE